jgi:hypothetical protein
MARYNTTIQSASQSGATTIGSPSQGLFTTLTGSAPFTVTLANPGAFEGSSQTFWNSTSGAVTISTPTGVIRNPGTDTATFVMPADTVATFTSNGTDYVLSGNSGGPSIFNGAVTISPATGAVTINPTTVGTINNTSIGASTRSTGAFTTLGANQLVTFDKNTDATSSTDGGTLTVTGGIAASGKIYSGGGFNGALTGNVNGTVTSTTGTTSFSGAAVLQSSGTTTLTGTVTINGGTPLTATTSPYLGTNSIIRTNTQTISENIVIPSGTAGMTAGPVTIAAGFTVTVNGDWSIV